MEISSYMKKSGSQQNFDKKPPTMARGFVGNGATRSVVPSVSAQSRSTSSTSVGSPSSRSEAAMSSRGRDGSFLGMEMDSLDVQADDAGSQGIVGTGKKKRAQRAVGGDKSARGLRQFSMRVCEKVEEKRRTTYNEVADELVAEFQVPNNSSSSPDKQPYDEKNIRRRVYDALNVLMAMDIISKDKKDIQWRGLPQTSLNDIEALKTQRDDYQNRIDKKAAYLQELQEQHLGLQNLIKRNEQLYGSGNTPSGGVALPFIMVQTRPHATVELEISEDMQLVHFDFNSTPFELHDDSHVLRAMNLCGRPENPQNGAQNMSMTNGEGERSIVQRNLGRPPAVPGILKGGRSMHNR